MSCVFIKVKARSDIWQVGKENHKSDLFSSNWQAKAVFDASIVRRLKVRHKHYLASHELFAKKNTHKKRRGLMI